MKFITSEVKKKLATINPNIKILGSYTGSGSPILCVCSKCKHKWSPCWDSLKQGVGCPQCGLASNRTKQQYNLATIVKKLRAINSKITIVSGSYENNKSPLQCQCRTCSYEWQTNWSKLSQGYGCPLCWRQRVAGEQRHSLAWIKGQLARISPNVTLLATEYKKNDQPMPCKCHVCGHTWSATWQALRHGTGCPMCYWQTRKLTTAEAKQQIERLCPPVVVLGEYTTYENPIECKCKACGSQFGLSLYNAKRYHSGCPQCMSKSNCEEEVRAAIENLTGFKFPRANPSEVPWLHGLHLDGFCPSYKSSKFPNGTAFERQGEQHYYLVNLGGNKDTPARLARRKRNDLRKRIQCWRHGVRLIKVPYWIKNVESFLQQRLSL